MEECTVQDERPIDLEGHFVLRMPPNPAKSLRYALKSEESNLRSRLRIELESDMRHAKVRFDGWILNAKVFDLPAIIESHKTVDRKVFHKIADISQIMVCQETDEERSDPEDSSPVKIDKDGRDKRYLYPHGITSCLKNCRKRRFRKRLRKKYTELPTVENEVKMLMKTDAEAISYTFELVNIEDEKKSPDEDKNSEITESKGICSETSKSVGEREIFGSDLSSSDGEAEDVNVTSFIDNEDNHETMEGINADEDSLLDSSSYDFRSAQLEGHDFANGGAVGFNYQLESEAAEKNLNQILQETETKGDRQKMMEKLCALEEEIDSLLLQKQSLERSLDGVDNMALKERFKQNIKAIISQIHQKKKELAELQTMFSYLP